MKLFSVYVVFVVFAVAFAPAASHIVATVAMQTLGTAFLDLIKTKLMILETERENIRVLTPALNDIVRELNEGLDSDIFRFGVDIHKALIYINIKVGQISGNTTSLASEIEATADTISKVHLNKKLADYTLKKTRVKQICDESLDKTKLVLTLIDETKAMLGINVSVPLKYLRTSMEATSQAKIEENRAIIRREVEATDHWWIWFFPRVESTAKAIKAQSEDKIQKIQIILNTISNHIEWLEKRCIDIKDQLDKSRTKISKFIMLFNKTITEDELEDATSVIVETMIQMKNEVLEILNSRQRRSVPSNPLWFNLNMSTDNGCVYIYNNRTVGCISNSTFSSLKKQYESLLRNISNFENVLSEYDQEIKTLSENVKANQLHSISDSNLNSSTAIAQRDSAPRNFLPLQLSLIQVQANVDTTKDEVKKISDLSATLNSFAESLFSEANAQKAVTKNVDDQLMEHVNEFLAENQKKAEELSEKYLRNQLAIKQQLNTIRTSPLVIVDKKPQLPKNGSLILPF